MNALRSSKAHLQYQTDRHMAQREAEVISNEATVIKTTVVYIETEIEHGY